MCSSRRYTAFQIKPAKAGTGDLARAIEKGAKTVMAQTSTQRPGTGWRSVSDLALGKRLRLGFGTALVLLSGCDEGSAPNPTLPQAISTPAPAPKPTPTPASTAVEPCMTSPTWLPWGKLGATRTWTPVDTDPSSGRADDAGRAAGAPFSARMVLAFGRDADFSRRTVVLELPNGCRRTFQARSFGAADIAEIDARQAEHPSEADARSYAIDYQPGRATETAIASGRLKVLHTQHFSIWYGTDVNAFSYEQENRRGRPWDEMIRDTGAWAEQIWLMDRDILAAPMPYSSDANPKRVNIYVCGTGLPWISGGDQDDCGASASDALFVSSAYLQPGSTTLIHEFSHTISFYTGGFRDRPSAGPAWESFAEWNSVSLSLNGGVQVPSYLGELEKGPGFSDLRYANWPWLIALSESDVTRPLLWRVWTDNLRDPSGRSREDQMETIVRLGQANGAFPSGWRSFADFMGNFGSRLAAADFQMQKALLDYASAVPQEKRYAKLSPIPGTSDFQSPADRPLLQYGTHLIRLTPTPGAATIRVRVTGIPQGAKSAWRFRIVAIDDRNVASYSSLARIDDGASGTAEIAATPNRRYVLAVTATPYVYQPLGWAGDSSFATPTKFPYRVDVAGASPR